MRVVFVLVQLKPLSVIVVVPVRVRLTLHVSVNRRLCVGVFVTEKVEVGVLERVGLPVPLAVVQLREELRRDGEKLCGLRVWEVAVQLWLLEQLRVVLAVKRAEPVRDMLQEVVIDGLKVKVVLIKRLWESLELALNVGLTEVVTDMPRVVVCVTLGVGVGVRLPGEAASV